MPENLIDAALKNQTATQTPPPNLVDAAFGRGSSSSGNLIDQAFARQSQQTAAPQQEQKPVSDPDRPWYKKVWDWANEPVFDESQVEGFLGDTIGLGHSGWTKGAADLLAGFTSPLSIGLTIASLPFGGEGGVIGSLVDSGGATALREAAGFGASEINEFTKAAHLMQDAFRTGKATTEAEAISEAVTRGSALSATRLQQGLDALKNSGVTAESLMSNGVVRRTAASMFRHLGADVATAENFGRWTQVAADAGFTSQAALGAVAASPRVFDAIKEGDYESAKRFAVDALGGAAFATLGTIGLRHEAGGLWQDIRGKYGLEAPPSETYQKIRDEFGSYDEMTKTLGIRFDNWLKDFREQNKDIQPDDLHRMMKWIQAGADPRLMAMRYNWLAEAAGRPDRIPVPPASFSGSVGTPQKFSFAIDDKPQAYEKLQDFRKRYDELIAQNEDLGRKVDEKMAAAKLEAGMDHDKYVSIMDAHKALLQSFSASAKELSKMKDELDNLDPRIGELHITKNGETAAFLSDRAWDLLARATDYKSGKDINGISLSALDIKDILQRLPSIATNSEENDVVSRLSRLLYQGQEQSGTGGLAVIGTKGRGVRTAINALREELLHNWQRSLGQGWVEDHLSEDDFKSLSDSLPESMKKFMLQSGYKDVPTELVVEGAAKIMAGLHKVGGVADEEAAQWLSKYFEAVKKQHGGEAIKQLNHTFGIAKQIQDGFVKLYDESKSQSEKEVSNSRPSDEFVQRLGERGLAGDTQAATGQPQRRLPTVEELKKQYGTTPFISQAGFVASDGTMIPLVGEHDRMLGGKPTDNLREGFINQTGTMRARMRTGRMGKEMVFSVPEQGLSDQQIGKIMEAAEILPSGQISIEVARPGGRYDVIEHPTPGKIVQSLENIFGKKTSLGFADDAAQTMRDTGGFTYNPQTGRVNRGYAFEILPEYRKTLDHPVKASDIRNFYLEHKSLFDSNPELHIGGFDNELNISATSEDRGFAEKMARKLDQRSIADLSKIPASGAPPDEAFIDTGGKGEARSFPGFSESQRLQELRSNPPFGQAQRRDVGQTTGLLKKPFRGQMDRKIDEIAQLFKDYNESKHLPMLDVVSAEPEKMTARARGIGSAEIRRQLAEENSGQFWYTQDVDKALNELAKLHPELQDDPVRRQFVLSLGAAASLGNDSPSTVKLMDEMYSLFKQNGKINATRLDGRDWGSEHSNANRYVLQNLQKIVDHNGGDLSATMEWLKTKHPISELRAVRGKTSGVPGKATDMAYGAYAMAPKAGRFFLNMSGIADEVTMDKWFMRTWNRWMGTLVNKDGSVNEKPPTPKVRAVAEKAFRELADSFGLKPNEAQAVMWFYEQNLWRAHGADIKAGDSYGSAATEYVARKLQSPEYAEAGGRVSTKPPYAGYGGVHESYGPSSREVQTGDETFDFGANRRIGQAQRQPLGPLADENIFEEPKVLTKEEQDRLDLFDRAYRAQEARKAYEGTSKLDLPRHHGKSERDIALESYNALPRPVTGGGTPFVTNDPASMEYSNYPQSGPTKTWRMPSPQEENEWKQAMARQGKPIGQAQRTPKKVGTDEQRIKELVAQQHVKNRLTGPEIDKLLDSYDYRKMTQRHKDVAKILSDKLADNFAFAAKNKVLEHAVQNYVTQYWQNDKSGLAANRLYQQAHVGGFAINSTMARHRVFQNAFEGELMGRKLAYTDPALLAAHNGNEFGRIVAARKVIANIADKGFLASDGMPMVALKGSGHVVEGEEGENPAVMVNPDSIRSIRINSDMINEMKKNGRLDKFLDEGKIIEYKDKKGNPIYAWDVSGYRTVDHPVMHKWKWATQDTKGNNVIMRSEMMVHPEAYDYINRRLGVEQSSIGKTAIGKGLLKVGREAKGMLLFGSPFHMIQEGLRAVMTGVSPFGLERIDLDKDPLIGKLVNHGLTIGKDYKGITSFEDSQMAGHSKILDKIPILGKIQDKTSEFLFDKYIPSLKVRAARALYERYKNAYPEWTDAKVSAVTAADVNERFGGINYARLGRSVATQDWFRLVALAPDWLESEVRFMARSFGTEGKIARRDIARIAAGLWIATRVINELSTGNPHFEAPFSVAHKDKEGNEKLYSVRTLPTDMFHAISDPGGFLAGRVSPILRTATETISGRDEFGKKLPSHGLMLPAEAFIRSAAPIPAQTIAKQITGETPELSNVDQAVKMLGGTVFTYKTEASKLAAQLASERAESGPIDPSKLRHHQLVQRMEDDLRNGQMQTSDLNKLVEEGSLSLKDAKTMRKNVQDTEGMDSDLARLYSRAARLDMPSFLKVWDASTNNEKAALAKLLTRKRQSYFKKMLSEATPAERMSDPTYQRLRQLFPQESLF